MAPTGASRARLVTLHHGIEQFQSRFVRVCAAALGLVAVGAAIAGAATGAMVTLVGGAVAAVTYGLSFWLTMRGNGLTGRRLLVYGLAVNAFGNALAAAGGLGDLALYSIIAVLVISLAGFVLEKIDLVLTVVASFVVVAVLTAKQVALPGWNSKTAMAYGLVAGVMAVEAIAVTLFVDNSRRNQLALRSYVDEVDRVMTHAELISKGDLTGEVDGDSDVSETIRAMLEGLRTMVSQSRDAASAIASSAQEITAMARQQEQGAIEQASAVEQIHTTLARLLAGSGRAAQSTEDVFRNVELTQRTTEVVAQRAAALSAHTRRISALLEVIKNIANKSEILALNAALEGARAGEAGRGFSLVASQMQRLAESVMGQVRDVRALIEDIDAATSATLAATEESTRLSAKATDAARRISGTLEQQRTGTEQVAAAMRDIHQVTAQVSAGSTQALSATRDLTRLAGELKHSIEKFQVA